MAVSCDVFLFPHGYYTRVPRGEKRVETEHNMGDTRQICWHNTELCRKRWSSWALLAVLLDTSIRHCRSNTNPPLRLCYSSLWRTPNMCPRTLCFPYVAPTSDSHDGLEMYKRPLTCQEANGNMHIRYIDVHACQTCQSLCISVTSKDDKAPQPHNLCGFWPRHANPTPQQ